MEEHRTLGAYVRSTPERLLLDWTCPVGTDWTLGCLSPVDSSKVPERVFLDRKRSVGADRTLVRVQSELNGASGHLDRCVRSARRVMTQPPNVMF